MNINLQIDKFIFSFQKFISNNKEVLITLISGFLLGRLTNEFSLPNANFTDVIQAMFSISTKPVNVVSWILLILLVFILLADQLLKKMHKQKLSVKLQNILKKHKSETIASFDGIAWGNIISLQVCPELHTGWKISEVKITHNTNFFSIPKEYKNEYDEYVKKEFTIKGLNDNEKIMLIKNPASFTDSLKLEIETCNTLYSQIQYYKNKISSIAIQQKALINEALNNNSIKFPHSLCMHVIITTHDDKIILTKRSKKVNYYPDHWSCSAEEQLIMSDFSDNDEFISKWTFRLLREEFGLSENDYNKNNIRTLSVFLEAEILNISFCVLVVLDISENELKSRLEGFCRKDYEFANFEFLTYDNLFDELLEPKRKYHPSAGYRMLMALIKKIGPPGLTEKFIKYK